MRACNKSYTYMCVCVYELVIALTQDKNNVGLKYKCCIGAAALFVNTRLKTGIVSFTGGTNIHIFATTPGDNPI